MSTKSDWIYVPVTPEMEKQAKAIRTQRKNLHKGRDGVESDENRWIGDLGAIALEQWFAEIGLGARWLRGKYVYGADFEIGGESVRVRCSKRNRFSPDEGIGLNERHRKHSRDTRYVFSVYDTKSVILIGTMLLRDFINVSNQYASGELIPVGNAYVTLPNGTKLYDVPMTHAWPMKSWLRGVAELPALAEQTRLFDLGAPVITGKLSKKQREKIDEADPFRR